MCHTSQPENRSLYSSTTWLPSGDRWSSLQCSSHPWNGRILRRVSHVSSMLKYSSKIDSAHLQTHSSLLSTPPLAIPLPPHSSCSWTYSLFIYLLMHLCVRNYKLTLLRSGFPFHILPNRTNSLRTFINTFVCSMIFRDTIIWISMYLN